MKYTAVIMAGGKGERFWPKSRANLPKQFLSLTGDGKTMIQLTVERLLNVVAMEDIFVVTNKNYRDIVQQQLPLLPADNILCEPMAKNTAPCAAYAAAVIGAKYGDAVMCIVPSDHIIKNQHLFADNLKLAARIAEKDNHLVTIGITPTYAETGYGYIKFKQDTGDEMPGAYQVDCFVEKPDIDTARRYLDEGTYLWNSGMFVWKVSSILQNMQTFLPEIYDGAEKIKQAFGTASYEQTVYDVFSACPSVSIDYGIMEKAENIYTIPGTFAWDDVGSWLSLERINLVDGKGNFIKGNVVEIGTENSVFMSEHRLIAAVGVQNLIVVETDDVTLVCDKDNTQDVKKIVEKLRAQGATQYL
ncbi:MAG: mannose-1-phosphate guanylyltransferase [Ruthenibacterium sp.]